MSFMALSISDISIHVPIAGNDHISSCRYWFNRDFNPRSHCRERRWNVQSRTLYLFISIHVPIAGNDWDTYGSWNNYTYFNPRSHCRERLEEGGDGDARRDISIHVPIAGNDGNHQPFSALETSFQSTFPLQGTTANLSNF